MAFPKNRGRSVAPAPGLTLREMTPEYWECVDAIVRAAEQPPFPVFRSTHAEARDCTDAARRLIGRVLKREFGPSLCADLTSRVDGLAVAADLLGKHTCREPFTDSSSCDGVGDVTGSTELAPIPCPMRVACLTRAELEPPVRTNADRDGMDCTT